VLVPRVRDRSDARLAKAQRGPGQGNERAPAARRARARLRRLRQDLRLQELGGRSLPALPAPAQDRAASITQAAAPAKSGKSGTAAGRAASLGCTVTVAPVKNPEDPVDEVARGRLRAAIVAEDGDEEQLDGVMRMLRAVVPKQDQLPLFGEADRHPPATRLR